MEGLHVVMEDIVRNGIFRVANVGLVGLYVSHLFYAGNALFMGEWDEETIRCLIRIINCFYIMVGLQLKLVKSNLLGVGVEFESCQALSLVIGCHAATFRLNTFESLLEKI